MDFAKIRPRGGTKAQWETANPVLGKREMGVQWESEIGVGKVVIKFGNGVTAWNNLDTAVEVENDLVNKIISSIVTVSDEYPILNDGDSLSALVGKIKKYIQDLKDKKLDKSARYDGTDSTSTELVPTANALRGVNAKADKNASDITTLNNNLSNFTVMRNASGVNQFKAVDQNGNNGMLFKVKDNSEFSVNVWKDNAFGNEKILATKDDLPNIFTTTLGTSNQESNHATTIKRLWNSFPERQVFACNLVDSNNFCVFGFTYGNHKYGAVLYLAFNSCGIVKCINGNFSDTEL